MGAVSDSEKDVYAGITPSKSELDFYNYASNPNNKPYLTKEESIYAEIIRKKMEFNGHGTKALNPNSFQAQTLYGPMSTSFAPGQSEINPVLVKSTSEISSRNNHHAFAPVKSTPGLYKDSDNIYYFVKEDKRKTGTVPTTTKYTGAQITAISPKKPTPTDTSTKTTPTIKAKTVEPTFEDLMFTSADYQQAYGAAIEDISMSLIRGGDDVITNFDYQSIDYVPDINVQIRYQDAVYLNAREVFDMIPESNFISSVIDNSDSSGEYEAANGVLNYLESLIGENVSYDQLLEYYGSYKNGYFTSKVSNPETGRVDFFIELPDEYSITGVSEYQIRFDPI